jgi:mannose-6-phosphate isomerase-like protein (cupin superfamily)
MTNFYKKLAWKDLVVVDADGKASKIRVADYVKGPVEVKVVLLKAGKEVPLHSHSKNTVHLILSGAVRIGRTIFRPFADYKCGGWEYRVYPMEDTLMLLIQPRGTSFKFADPSVKVASKKRAAKRKKN